MGSPLRLVSPGDDGKLRLGGGGGGDLECFSVRYLGTVSSSRGHREKQRERERERERVREKKEKIKERVTYVHLSRRTYGVPSWKFFREPFESTCSGLGVEQPVLQC